MHVLNLWPAGVLLVSVFIHVISLPDIFGMFGSGTPWLRLSWHIDAQGELGVNFNARASCAKTRMEIIGRIAMVNSYAAGLR